MRAAVIRDYGPPDVLHVEDVPMPVVGPRDLLIEVHAAAVNPVDTKMRKGSFRGAVRWPMPWILGMDVSGVVREVGKSVTGFKVGDEVYSSPTHKRPGCYAEWVAIDERACAHKPKNTTHVEAAGIPMVALTAWEALITKAKVKPGEQVFVQAGAGGVGSMAIQLAKHLGAKVATTCSEANLDFVRSLGAERAIDYKKESYEKVLAQYDTAIEAFEHDSGQRTLGILRNGGFLVMLNSGIPDNVKKNGPILGLATALLEAAVFTIATFVRRRILVSHVLRRAHGPTLQKITELVEAGALKPIVDGVYPLEKIVEAHERSESGRAKGKIIIGIRS